MTAFGIRCSSCLDSGLVASDGTPWPTVLACPELRFELAEGIIRPKPAICQGCNGAAPDGGFADGYIAGHRAALAAARSANTLQGLVLPIAMAGRDWRAGPGTAGAVDARSAEAPRQQESHHDEGLTATIELRDDVEASLVEAALRAAAARHVGS